MATTLEFINYVCEQIYGIGEIRYRKMFGEYMVYVNEKPILLVCDNTVYVKKEECICIKMENAMCGYPYEGAKEHYILDIDDGRFSREIILELEKVIPVSKKKVRKQLTDR